MGDAESVSIFQSPAHGLGGVVASDTSNLGCVRVDLDPEGNEDEVNELLK
jgi:hypothetical protein